MDDFKKNRMLSIKEIPHFSSSVQTKSVAGIGVPLCNVELENDSYHLKLEHYIGIEDTYYHLPFLFEADTITPWEYGNLFIWDMATSAHQSLKSNNDIIRRKASNLMDYKIFVESVDSNIFDFESKRAVGRISYRYFVHLKNSGLSAGSINQKTLVVFEFYKWLSRQPDVKLDLKRVEMTKTAFIRFQGNSGEVTKQVESRSQTVQLAPPSSPKSGFVRDEGEDLRPLSLTQEKALWSALNDGSHSVMDRLIFEMALDTGARKQTILTLRIKHLDLFVNDNKERDGTYKLMCGPGTGIDTKFNKRFAIYIPSELADKLKLFAFSDKSRQKREKFKHQNPGMFEDGDEYVFLSNRGNCLYAAKDDPRLAKLGSSAPKGAYVQTIVDKLKAQSLPSDFPSDFTFHWSRATFAMRYLDYLQPLVDAEVISMSTAISMVQERLAHKDRETTENYLKLYKGIDEKMALQDRFEDRMFKGVASIAV